MSDNNINHRDMPAMRWLKNIFVKPRQISAGDMGIYHYIWGCDTFHEDSYGLKYDVYAKIKSLDVYESLIEIEALDIKINDSASTEIQNIIKNNFPKYVNPKYVKWQLKATPQQ